MKKMNLLFCLVILAFPLYARMIFQVPDNVEVMSWNRIDSLEKGHKDFEIDADELPKLQSIDFSRYPEIEWVVIGFAIFPDAPDVDKEAVLKRFDNNLKYLTGLKKCRKLKYIVLKAGEMIFIKAAEKEKMEVNLYDLNLERCEKRYAEKIEKILPGIVIYGQNWPY